MNSELFTISYYFQLVSKFLRIENIVRDKITVCFAMRLSMTSYLCPGYSNLMETGHQSGARMNIQLLISQPDDILSY